jgi:hypothetical protein
MGNRRWRILVTIIASYLATCAIGVAQGTKSSSQSKTQAKDARVAAGAAAQPKVIGAASCAKSGCHGAVTPARRKPDEILRNESTLFGKDKRHQGAYQLLKAEKSKTIARNLAKLDGRDEPVKPAHEDARCLSCHSIPYVSDYAHAAIRPVLSSGVGCESCHGPAEKWLLPHTEDKNWRTKTPEQKKSLGMNDTKDWIVRAKVCAGCHVGAPADEKNGVQGRDAFHDIMAAGHPRLNFEFSVLSDVMPQHWRKPQRQADSATRAWLIGQLVFAESSLDLTRARATDAANNKLPWPEFAEYDCFACHHDLSEPSWYQERKYGQRTPGTLPWGTWYFTMVKSLPGTDAGKGRAFVEQLAKLQKLLVPDKATTKLTVQSAPDPKLVANEADRALELLRDWTPSVAKAAIDREASRRWIKDWVSAAQEQKILDWDAANQLYYALDAISQDEPNANLRESTGALVKPLGNRPGDYSPKDFDAALSQLLRKLNE